MKNIKKISLMLVVILLMIVFVGCNKSDYAHLPKEDQEIYLELYTLYDIVRKGYEGEIELPIKDKKLLDRYVELRDKYNDYDNVNNDTQKQLLNLIWGTITLDRSLEINKETIEENFIEIQQIFDGLKN